MNDNIPAPADLHIVLMCSVDHPCPDTDGFDNRTKMEIERHLCSSSQQGIAQVCDEITKALTSLCTTRDVTPCS